MTVPVHTLILGGGPAGLAAAAHLPDALLYEANSYVGGHCRTKWAGAFGFDEGAHVFFGRDEDAQKFVLEPLRDSLHEREAEIWNCYEPGRLGRYPVQLNAHALAPEQAARCVADFAKASLAPVPGMPRTYADWCKAAFGEAFSDEFFFRYARKVWTVDPAELTTEWLGSAAGARIHRPDLLAVVRGAIDPQPQTANYLQRFWYPRDGGFEAILAPLVAAVAPSRLRLGRRLDRWNVRDRVMQFSDGTTVTFDRVISTIPLPALVECCDDVPGDVLDASRRLRWTSNRCVSFGVARGDVGPGDWCYYYAEDVPFFRSSVPSRFAGSNAPAGHSALTCEIAYSRWQPLDENGLEERVLASLRECGILRPEDRIVVADQTDAPFAYVIFDANRPAAVETIHAWLRDHRIEPAGRFGEWGYHWSFEAIGSGRRAAERVRAS